ncbi:hypothetical protein EDC94DRAFT_581024 [Helicostylum pulchrum]|uniref:Uncharacterized protein n=1 Tax=Helicostylum pulchrum TaxID=562976 RepID=A0ABP9XZR1_9FUNG|nr:hypothetical protein EDC94DRAFT_581024 [Helicostylum pulchrum]
MNTIDHYDVSFEGCTTYRYDWGQKTVTLRAACAPLEANGTKTECAGDAGFYKDCYSYAITTEERQADGVKLQCFIECTPTPHNTTGSRTGVMAPTNHIADGIPPNYFSGYTGSAVAVYPTFFITFVALVFVLLLSSKRSH